MNAKTGMSRPIPAMACEARDGFEVRRLRSPAVEVAVVPELGARVVSLKNLRTGREWMYHPGSRSRWFRNQPGDDFARGPVAGWDECLPTTAPCLWRGRSLPDHGEVWTAAWNLDEAAWERGVIKTSVRLPVSLFEFTRAIELEGNTLHADYQLLSLDSEPQEFLWTMHPLLALRPGDRLVLPGETRRRLENEPWIDSLDFGERIPACGKAFAGPLRQGWAEVFNSISQDRLALEWNAAECGTLGVWLTRGGWHGHHHLALEPANGAPDSLAIAAGEWNRCGRLAPFARKKWSVRIRLQPSA
ncbi:MAG: hypothetical protein KGJ60_06995 [Verrucomicrobiota bacterium]|nr:hypothetical protein [Verrucomicrobiota bacterium]